MKREATASASAARSVAEAGQRRAGDEIERQIGAMVRVQQRADVDQAAGGRGQASVERVGRGFAGPVGQSAPEFGGLFVGDQAVEAGIERIFLALGVRRGCRR